MTRGYAPCEVETSGGKPVRVTWRGHVHHIDRIVSAWTHVGDYPVRPVGPANPVRESRHWVVIAGGHEYELRRDEPDGAWLISTDNENAPGQHLPGPAEGAHIATDPEGADTVTDSTDDQGREDFIVNLRVLADLLDNVPEIPIRPSQVISFPLDLEAFEAVDACARALAVAGVPFHRARGTGCEHLEFEVGTLTYRFSTMTAEEWARAEESRSYDRNVRTGGA